MRRAAVPTGLDTDRHRHHDRPRSEAGRVHEHVVDGCSRPECDDFLGGATNQRWLGGSRVAIELSCGLGDLGK